MLDNDIHHQKQWKNKLEKEDFMEKRKIQKTKKPEKEAKTKWWSWSKLEFPDLYITWILFYFFLKYLTLQN